MPVSAFTHCARTSPFVPWRRATSSPKARRTASATSVPSKRSSHERRLALKADLTAADARLAHHVTDLLQLSGVDLETPRGRELRRGVFVKVCMQSCTRYPNVHRPRGPAYEVFLDAHDPRSWLLLRMFSTVHRSALCVSPRRRGDGEPRASRPEALVDLLVAPCYVEWFLVCAQALPHARVEPMKESSSRLERRGVRVYRVPVRCRSHGASPRGRARVQVRWEGECRRGCASSRVAVVGGSAQFCAPQVK